MQYFKFQAVIDDQPFVESIDSKVASRKLAHKICVKSAEFNEKHAGKGFIFVSFLEEERINIGLLAEKIPDVEKFLAKYMKYLELRVADVKTEEVTLTTFVNLLGSACHYFFIEDDDEILDSFDLNGLSDRFGRNFRFGESLMEDTSNEELIADASKYLSKEYLVPELENILSMQVKAGKYGHPVHYFVETDDNELRKDFYRLILQALRLSGRIMSRRYSYIDISPASEIHRRALECLYKSSFGGAIVIRIKVSGAAESDCASAERENISIACEMMRKYRNQVLTVFCMPRECTKLKEQLYEELGNICFIEIKEDLAKNEDATAFLKMLAKENHIRSDKALISRIEENEGYLSNQLRDIFDVWYDKKLRNSIFPQYKEAASVKKKYRKLTPKGSAYDELAEMVGIAEAKKVIRQALDFYKAQKLFKDKGMADDTMSMHMCFTGSPGTCKTTCARLFAQIMKDNGLLSKGHLVELTANELKGKYVGWTGPQVKKAFESAKGGVLFLDEIYSLVEDRDGSFGDEAIANIVAEMENHRDEVICIFAGYKDKTEQFLQKNPGLRSRIAFHVSFEDYTTDELCDITRLIARNKGRKFTDDAMDKLRLLYDEIKDEPDFGQGRYCRNIVEKAKLAQASRLVTMDYDSVTKDDIETLISADIPLPETKAEEKRRIGFCA